MNDTSPMGSPRAAVLAFTRRQIAKALASAFLVGGVQLSALCANNLFSSIALAAPQGSVLSTLRLVNDGNLTQVANVPTQTFGWLFKDGDIAPGTAPIFSMSGVIQPFSAGLQSYWPSGCLMFATFMLRPTFSLSARTSRTVTISSGGRWPAASGRTLTEVYAQNIVVNLPPMPGASMQTRPSTVSAWLRGDGNNYKQTVWLDGAAGKAWKVSTQMAASVGGAPDGQLVFDHYIIALNNSSGNLGGFRWYGCARLPKYNNDTPAKTPLFFATPSAAAPVSGVNWQINPLGRGLRTIPLPFAQIAKSVAFSYSGGNIAGGAATNCAAANGYWSGAGSNGNMVPGLVTGGSLPSPLKNGQPVWALNSNQSDLTFFYGPSCVPDLTIPLTGAGSGTFTPCAAIACFTRLNFANTNAEYNFFQGTGSIAADTTLRATIDRAYWQSTGLIPSYDQTLRGSAEGGAITDDTYPFDWNPYNISTFAQNQGQGGDHPDIGILPNIAVIEYYNQSKVGLKDVRIIGLSAGLQCCDFKDATLDTIVNLGAGTYQNLSNTGPQGPLSTTLQWGSHDSGNAAGFTAPPQPPGCMAFSTSTPDHEPNYALWAYLRTGELQYLDFMVELANAKILTMAPGDRNPRAANGDAPYDATGILTYHVDQYRSIGWGLRDLEQAALFYPFDPTNNPANPVYSDGSQVARYLRDQADASANFPIDQWNMPAPGVYGAQYGYVKRAAMWSPFQANLNGSPAYAGASAEWEKAYIGNGMIFAANRGNTKAAQFLTNILGPRMTYIGKTFGYWMVYGYYGLNAKQSLPFTGTETAGYPMIGADDNYGISMLTFFPAVTWQPNSRGGPAFKITSLAGHGGYTMRNGDILIPQTFTNPNISFPPVLAVSTPYWVRDLTRFAVGGTFNLAASPTGPAVTITNSASGSSLVVFVQPKTTPSTSFPYASNFMLQCWQPCAWAKAKGYSGFNGITADIRARATADLGGVFYQGGGGRYTPIDARYCFQTTLA